MPVVINEVEVLEPAVTAAGTAASTPGPAPAPAVSADALRRVLDDMAGRRARREAD